MGSRSPRPGPRHRPPVPSSQARRHPLESASRELNRLTGDFAAGSLQSQSYLVAVHTVVAALRDFDAPPDPHQLSPERGIAHYLCIQLPSLGSRAGRFLANLGIGGLRLQRNGNGGAAVAAATSEPKRIAELTSTRSLFWAVSVSRSPREMISEHQALIRALKRGHPVPVLVQYFDGRPAELVFEPWSGSKSVVAKKPRSHRPPGHPRRLLSDTLRASFRRNPTLSLAARARVLGVSRSTVSREAHRLGLLPF
jgi:hypothetical protein